MNWKMAVGIVLIVLGVMALAFQGFTWYSRKPIIRIATVHMDVTVKHKLFAEPIAAGLVIAAGVVLVLLGRKSPKA
jgi:drug/metabolite transporter (DMT)-like permease